MVQINAEYYEDLNPDILEQLLDDLAAGRRVRPGPQNGRVSSEPHGDVKTLTDPALFDGSLVGAWRKRFEEPAVAAAGDMAADAKVAAEDPRKGKPDAGRALGRAIETPANRAAEGKAPIAEKDRAEAGAEDRATKVEPRTEEAPTDVPQSQKSYTGTPAKPAEGRPVASDLGTTPVAGTPPSDAPARRDGSESKPDVPVDKSPSPDSPGKT